MNIYKLVIAITISLFLFSCSNAKFQSGQKVFIELDDTLTIWPSIPGYAVGNVVEEKDNMILVQVSEINKKESQPSSLEEGSAIYIPIDKITDYEKGKNSYDEKLLVVSKAFTYFKTVVEIKNNSYRKFEDIPLPDEDVANNLIKKANAIGLEYLAPIFISTSLFKNMMASGELIESGNLSPFRKLIEESYSLLKKNQESYDQIYKILTDAESITGYSKRKISRIRSIKNFQNLDSSLGVIYLMDSNQTAATMSLISIISAVNDMFNHYVHRIKTIEKMVVIKDEIKNISALAAKVLTNNGKNKELQANISLEEFNQRFKQSFNEYVTKLIRKESLRLCLN